MQGKMTASITKRRETEILGSEARCDARLAPLLARIARRQGRWRGRSSGKPGWDEPQPAPFPEAA